MDIQSNARGQGSPYGPQRSASQGTEQGENGRFEGPKDDVQHNCLSIGGEDMVC